MTEPGLAAREAARMGVEFFVDPEIFNDPNTRDVTTITLSYTFFPAPEKKAQARPARPARPDSDLPKG